MPARQERGRLRRGRARRCRGWPPVPRRAGGPQTRSLRAIRSGPDPGGRCGRCRWRPSPPADAAGKRPASGSRSGSGRRTSMRSRGDDSDGRGGVVSEWVRPQAGVRAARGLGKFQGHRIQPPRLWNPAGQGRFWVWSVARQRGLRLCELRPEPSFKPEGLNRPWSPGNAGAGCPGRGSGFTSPPAGRTGECCPGQRSVEASVTPAGRGHRPRWPMRFPPGSRSPGSYRRLRQRPRTGA